MIFFLHHWLLLYYINWLFPSVIFLRQRFSFRNQKNIMLWISCYCLWTPICILFCSRRATVVPIYKIYWDWTLKLYFLIKSRCNSSYRDCRTVDILNLIYQFNCCLRAMINGLDFSIWSRHLKLLSLMRLWRKLLLINWPLRTW